MLHREKATDLRNVDALSDKAVVLFERGDQRSAFVYFDLCVSARPFEARYRLSRAICAYALQMCAYDQFPSTQKPKSVF